MYFHNNDTKESVWTIPKELQDIKDRIAAEQQQQAAVNSPSAVSKKSAMDAAMAATLAAYKPPPAAAANDINLVPLPDMPKQVVFRDKREAMEALKDLLKVRPHVS